MKPLSQQVRELVTEQPTSVYAIAKQAGIDKATMSRFMNGGSLTMGKLDRLASVLGIIVTSDVSLVPRPLVKGRPPKKPIRRKKMDVTTAKRWADHYAKDAFTNHFSSRRGVWHIQDLDCLVVYNNNPFGVTSIRPREMQMIQDGANELGIATLARGEGGDVLNNCQDRYTATLLLDCGSDRLNEVVSIVQTAADWAVKEISDSVQGTRQ